MSIENKIRNILAGRQDLNESSPNPKQGDSKDADYTEIDPTVPVKNSKDTSRTSKTAETRPRQGDSKDADYSEYSEDDIPKTGRVTSKDTRVKQGGSESKQRQGSSQDATYKEINPYIGEDLDDELEEDLEDLSEEELMELSKSTLASYIKRSHRSGGSADFSHGKAVGNAGEFHKRPDRPEALKQANISKKRETGLNRAVNRLAKEDYESRKVEMNLEDLRRDIANIFAGDETLSEEFKTQASSIFEAAVVARVNQEIETLSEELAEAAIEQVEEEKEDIIDNIDRYLDFVVEQWMSENQPIIDKSLRTEVAEQFMHGLKNLFKEHYFEIPEDKVDVVEDMLEEVERTRALLDETIQNNLEIKEELEATKCEMILESMTKDMTDADAEKLAKLLEGVEFTNSKLYAKKVQVIKENYFPNNKFVSPERVLEEDVRNKSDSQNLTEDVPAHINRYVQAISRSQGFKK